MDANSTGPSPGDIDEAAVSDCRLRFAVATVVLVILCNAGRILPVFRDELQRYLGIGDQGFGALFSIGAATGIAAVVVGGALVDRWGPRRVLCWCFGGTAAAMALLALAGRNWRLMMIALGLQGIFSRPLIIAVTAYLMRLFPNNRRRALSLNLAAGSMAGIFFPTLAEGLLTLWRRVAAVSFAMIVHLPFVASALALALGSFLYRRRSAESAEEASASRRWHWRDLLLPRRTVFLVVLLALHGAADSILHVWMARFLGGGSFSSRPFAPGFALSGFAVAYLLARGGLALIPERRGRRSLMIVPGILGGGLLIAGILTRSYALTAAGYIGGAFLWSAEFPAILSVAVQQETERIGAVMALQQVICLTLTFVGVTGVGVVVARLGEAEMWRVMLVPAAAFPLVGLGSACWWLYSAARRRRREAAS